MHALNNTQTVKSAVRLASLFPGGHSLAKMGRAMDQLILPFH